MRDERRLDLGDVLGARLRAVERHAGGEVGAQPHRELVDDAAAEAEADRAELAGAVRARLQPVRRGDEVLAHLAAVDLPEQRRGLLVVARIAADRGQPVGREGDEVGDRQPPRDVLDVRVEAAVLVHDQDGRQFSGRFAGRTR